MRYQYDCDHEFVTVVANCSQAPDIAIAGVGSTVATNSSNAIRMHTVFTMIITP